MPLFSGIYAFPTDETVSKKPKPKKSPDYLKFVARKNKQLRQGKISIKQYKKEIAKKKKYWK